MSEMKHLNKETLAICMSILFKKISFPKRILITPDDYENGEIKLNPSVLDDISTYGLGDVLQFKNEKSLHIRLLEWKEPKLLEFLQKYIENFKNNKLEVGVPSFLNFEENIEWGYKILHDASIGEKNKIVISSDYLGLKEIYPNLPEGIRLLEFLLFLHFNQLINITDCDYLQEYGARIKIELINSPEKIKSDLELEKNPALKGYSHSVIKIPKRRHVINHSNGSFSCISKPRIWDIFNDLIQINHTSNVKIDCIANKYGIKNQNGNSETPLKTYVGEINTMLREIHDNKNKKYQYVKIKNGLFEINIP